LQSSGWNLRDHIPLDEVIVQSHRGAGRLMAENSAPAFELAWSLGTIPEADLRTTRDGVIVAFHDDTFQRILPDAPPERQAQGIGDLTWDEVSRLDIGAWKGPVFEGQRVPRLADVFAMLGESPERRIYVDIKTVDLEQLALEAEAARVTERLILASPGYGVLRRWKALAQESPTLHWMGGTEAQLESRLGDLREAGFAAVDQLQIHVRRTNDGFTPSARFLERTGRELRDHAILFQAFPWGMADPRDFFELMDLGVASFATDDPDVAMKAIRDYYAGDPFV
jgi:glycerophosphoryl diester phosphodiesterase